MPQMSDRPRIHQARPIPEITVREAYARLTAPADDRQPPALIDVRERDEYAEGHAAGALSLPLSELQVRVGEVPRDRDVLLICHLGQRSMFAAQYLRQQGIERVFNVDGGTDEWERAHLPRAR
jgi:rhodanese-related sulfurtransferase